MTLLSLPLGLVAAVLLLAAGWLAGVKRGADAREQLRGLTFLQGREMQEMRERHAAEASRRERLLKTTIEETLAPLVRRDRFDLDLSRLDVDAGRRRDLGLLLDKIAEVGNVSTVVLADEEGLPLAANGRGSEVDRRAADASLVLLLADRLGSGERPQPRAMVVHDSADETTVCRIFEVAGRRLMLSATTTDGRLTPTALDPVLVKVVAMLAPSE